MSIEQKDVLNLLEAAPKLRPLLMRLGGGQRARRHLGVVGVPTAETGQVSVVEGKLTFQDLELANVSEKTVK